MTMKKGSLYVCSRSLLVPSHHSPQMAQCGKMRNLDWFIPILQKKPNGPISYLMTILVHSSIQKAKWLFCEFCHSVWNGWSTTKGWMLSHLPLFVGWIYWHSLVVHSRIITIGENTKAINVMRDSCLCKVKFPITFTEYTYSHLMGYRVSILV